MQGNLPFVEVRDEISDAEILRRCKDVKSSLKLCVSFSGRNLKEVAFDLEIDVNHLTRMLSDNPEDNRHFPPNMIPALMVACGNQIPLRYLTLSHGYGLHKLKSRLEEENDHLKRQLAEQELRLSTITEFMRSVKGAA